MRDVFRGDLFRYSQDVHGHDHGIGRLINILRRNRVKNDRRHQDPSLSLPVVLRDDAVQVLLEILDDHLVIGQHRHGEDIRFLEHGIAVAAVQQETGAREGVFRLLVEGLLSDHHIGNPVFPGHGDKLVFIVHDDTALQLRIHAECDAGDLQEASGNGRQL